MTGASLTKPINPHTHTRARRYVPALELGRTAVARRPARIQIGHDVVPRDHLQQLDRARLALGHLCRPLQPLAQRDQARVVVKRDASHVVIVAAADDDRRPHGQHRLLGPAALIGPRATLLRVHDCGKND